jgi:putative aldouronate transport system permease protein
MLIPALLYIIIFHYGPMYGVQIAFKDFNPYDGITGSPWRGFDHFVRFFNSASFWRIVGNTVFINLYQLVAAFPMPILLAIAMNMVRARRFTKTVQLVTYAPHFISTVVIVGMLNVFFSRNFGLANHALEAIGMGRFSFLGEPGVFRDMYVWSGIWQRTGWGSIIYLAALSAVDPNLHEAAIVDGASIRQRVWHIDIPAITPTIAILLILNVGRLMAEGFEKAYLMQNALNLETSEILSTYVYKVGLLQAQYSFSAAVGLFNAVINFALLLLVNRLAKSLGDYGLW